RLSRQVRQLLLAVDLRAPLRERLLEVGERLVVGGLRLRLLLGDGVRLGQRGCSSAERYSDGGDDGSERQCAELRCALGACICDHHAGYMPRVSVEAKVNF